MSAASIQQSRIRPGSVDPALWLGLLFGVALPLAMAEMFFTYVAVLQTVWLERAKLLELPIVAGEVLVIAWAFRQGFDRQVLWAALSRDIRWALVALFGALAVSSLLSTMPLEASLQSLIVVVHLYFAAAVYFLAARAPAFARGETFIAGLAWGLVPIALLTVVRFEFPPPLSEIPGGRIDWVFALPGFISVRYFGTWTGAVAAALAVGILHRGVAERQAWAWQGLYALAVGMTVWSGTRATVLGGAIALCLFVAFRWRAIDRRSALTVALLTGLGCVAAKALQFHDPIFQMVDAADQQGADAFTAGRLTLWLATIDAWRESPWIGHGTGSLFWTVFVGWRHTQPHNAVLQFLFSWGVIGALPACWLLLRAVLAAVRSAVREPAVWPVLTLAFSLMGMSMVDGALSYPRFVSMIAVGLALAFAAGMNRNPETG